jgi:catechol 2,3-dioxygenase-like lactoylglutathione lyase family enzyme
MAQTVIPQLRITHHARSLDFYVKQLGFTVDWQHQFEPGFPLFFQLTRDGQTLFLSEHAGDCEVGGAVYFRVPDATSLHAVFAAQGAVADALPTASPWGTVEFLLRDPDGNRLRFASETASAASA